MPAKKKRLYKSLFFQILIAIVAGVLIGHFWPSLGEDLRPLGDGFIRLIKLIIAPLIFLVIVTGIASVGHVKSVGRVGVKALLYFTCATCFALVFGLLVANLVQPGKGLNIDPNTLSADDVAAVTGGRHDGGNFLLSIIPYSVIGAVASNALLQVLILLSILRCGRHREWAGPLQTNDEPVRNTARGRLQDHVADHARGPHWGVGDKAFTIGQFGVGTLGTYAKLIAAC